MGPPRGALPAAGPLKYMSLPLIILASASPRRSELLGELGRPFQVIPSDAEEVRNDQLSAQEICQLNAYRKARAVAKRFPDALVIGADTLVFLEGVAFGKPHGAAEAFEMLSRLQGKSHDVVTGVCLIHLRAHRQRVFAVSTQVTFRSLTEPAIRRYLETVHTLDKAGAYAIQEKGEMLVASIDGSYSNVVGLPLERLEAELMTWPHSG